jgi:hypothetical protein
MEKKEEVKKEFELIDISLQAEVNRMNNMLMKQFKTGVITKKELYYFQTYYITNLTEKEQKNYENI